jgi:hypothetical protein
MLVSPPTVARIAIRPDDLMRRVNTPCARTLKVSIVFQL